LPTADDVAGHPKTISKWIAKSIHVSAQNGAQNGNLRVFFDAKIVKFAQESANLEHLRREWATFAKRSLRSPRHLGELSSPDTPRVGGWLSSIRPST
jgi:hypothetical protein